MSATAPTVQYLAAANDTAAWPANARLWTISVGTAVATAVVTVYEGTSTSGTVLAILDAGTAAICHNFNGARFAGGLFVKLTTAGAKVTITAG